MSPPMPTDSSSSLSRLKLGLTLRDGASRLLRVRTRRSFPFPDLMLRSAASAAHLEAWYRQVTISNHNSSASSRRLGPERASTLPRDILIVATTAPASQR